MPVMLHKLQKLVFDEQRTSLYAIIDAAKIEELTTQLLIYEPEYEILFEGEDLLLLEEVAPYLIKLEKGTAFSKWFFEEVYANNGAIFFESHYDVNTLKEHFKRFTKVSREIIDPKTNKRMLQEGYLAFYDPRVFPEWLESVEDDVKKSFLSLNENTYYEDLSQKEIVHFYDSNLELQTFSLAEGVKL